MRFVKFMLCAVVLIAGCSREMRLPTDPIADAGRSPRLSTDSKDNSNGHQSATGHVDQVQSVFGIAVIEKYSFSAIRTPHGKINGQFEFRARYQNVVIRAHGDVECLTITGTPEHAMARIGGRVTHSTFEEGIPIGTELTWSVTDNGEPGRGADTASQMFGAPAELYCAAGLSYPEVPITRGNVQVRP